MHCNKTRLFFSFTNDEDRTAREKGERPKNNSVVKSRNKKEKRTQDIRSTNSVYSNLENASPRCIPTYFFFFVFVSAFFFHQRCSASSSATDMRLVLVSVLRSLTLRENEHTSAPFLLDRTKKNQFFSFSHYFEEQRARRGRVFLLSLLSPKQTKTRRPRRRCAETRKISCCVSRVRAESSFSPLSLSPRRRRRRSSLAHKSHSLTEQHRA